MVFTDLKNDFMFRRIFARRPDILRGLLNDLLDRRGDRAIESIECLPSEQLPLVTGAKFSILDVRCRDRSGTTFVVEMQLLHVSGFYNPYKACADQLKQGEPYSKLTDVVVISICNFVLWPDAEQDVAKRPRVPMLSQWNMTERDSGTHGLLYVQHTFLELPKLPEGKPLFGADLWAWLFVHAPEMTEVSADLPPGPQREAVEMANTATFTKLELDAYQRVVFEIEQTRDYGAAQRAKGKAEGIAEGKAEGIAEGKARTILSVLEARGIVVSSEIRAVIAGCTDGVTLDRWITRAAIAASAEEVVAAA